MQRNWGQLGSLCETDPQVGKKCTCLQVTGIGLVMTAGGKGVIQGNRITASSGDPAIYREHSVTAPGIQRQLTSLEKPGVRSMSKYSLGRYQA